MNFNDFKIHRRVVGVVGAIVCGVLILVLAAGFQLHGLEQHVHQVRGDTATLSEIGRSAAISLALSIAFGLLLVALTLFAAAYLIRSVRQPLAQVMALADIIKEGDLSVQIDSARKDDFGDLLRSLASMNVSLGHMVFQIRESTKNVALVSVEIAQGNNDLAQRTERTSAGLQATASAMQRLTGTVVENSENAQQASALANSALVVSQRGRVIVDHVLSSMHEINAHSQKISAIVGVIDGIAFQTNLLALNAAVESASAGEQGRGFAVVASEVRTLARRSADAAREIKALVESSVHTVATGSTLVAQVGATMSEILTSISQAAVVIQEIATASDEQSAGARRVNQSVGHLDLVTQQNAALVEQMAAAASSLKSHAQILAQVVTQFQIDEPAQDEQPAIPNGHFTVGVETQNYLPISNGEGAVYSGFARELFDAFAHHAGYTFTYKPMPITHLFEEFLVSQRLDLKFPDNAYWAGDLKRKTQVVYSQGLVSVAEGLLVKPEHKGRDPGVLSKIAITRGFTPFPYLDRIQSQQIKVSELNTPEAGLKMAESGRVDGVYMGKIVADYLLNDIKKTPGVLVFDESLPNSTNDFSISTINHPEVIVKLDEFLRDQSDLVAKLKHKHNIFDQPRPQ
jgi:methyl-accepting chemotaxis protein